MFLCIWHGGNVLTAVKLAGELLICCAIRNSYEREAPSFQMGDNSVCLYCSSDKSCPLLQYKVCPFLYNENYKKMMQSIYFSLKATESCLY